MLVLRRGRAALSAGFYGRSGRSLTKMPAPIRTILVKPIIRVGLVSVTADLRAFACATHNDLLAGIPCRIQSYPLLPPHLRHVVPVRDAGDRHFLGSYEGWELW
jgi:hypothetical protein